MWRMWSPDILSPEHGDAEKGRGRSWPEDDPFRVGGPGLGEARLSAWEEEEWEPGGLLASFPVLSERSSSDQRKNRVSLLSM